MLVTSDIHRSIGRISLDLNRHMQRRQAEIRDSASAEFEVQFQIPFKAKLGGDLGLSGPPAPVEKTRKLHFGVVFQAFPGGRRRSHLTKPHVRGGIELTKVPTGGGIQAYWHVVRWNQDGRKNFTDAEVLIGVTRALQFAAAVAEVEGVLHVAFQGYGYVAHADQNHAITNCNASVNSDE